ncbi:MAG: NAD(P)/FAD-dependent oxidoreductase [Bacillota bacterium]
MLLKDRAEVVIIGGGVVGLAIAYNLAKKGMDEIVVLEREYLGSGATGRCGAGIRQQWGTEMNCRLARNSMDIFENMNEILETEMDIELKQQGYLLLAFSDKELEQFRKNLKLQARENIPSREVTPEEAKEIVPHLNIDDVVGGTFCPTDGHANPFLVVKAYADAAERLGVEINTFTEAIDITKEDGKIAGVQTDKGFIATERVVNAAGGYSCQVGEMAGLDLPVKPERHEILVTEKVEPYQGPMVMSFSYNIYCQQTPEGPFLMGFGDPDEPASFNRKSSWEFLEKMAEKTYNLLPPLGELRVVRQWAGLYNITPDRQPIITESKQVPGLYLALGFSGHGFMIAPMTGIIMAEMILGEELSLELNLDLERFEKGNLILEPSVV